MSNFVANNINLERDYELLSKWWKDWEWPIIPKEFLPNNGLIIKEKESNKLLCAAFLYSTDSKYCWIDWYISNKKITRDLRKEGLKFLIEKMGELAKKKGFLAAFSSISSKNQFLLKSCFHF